MFTDERKALILSYLAKQHRLIVADVARELDVSETTIRRDLHDLERQGLLRRTHGGAVGLEVAGFEPSIQEKSQRYAAEKSRIAKAAQRFIHAGATIILDAGTTTLQIARYLPDEEITVVTNSLDIAAEVSLRKNITLMMLGGELRKTTGAFVGPLTQLVLSQLHVDKVFLGINGVDLHRGLTTANSLEASTKRAMIEAAREVILVADFSKFDQIHLVAVGSLDVVDTLICDSPLPEEYQTTCDEIGIQTLIVQA